MSSCMTCKCLPKRTRQLLRATKHCRWHYTIEGQKDSEYAGGVYHGKLLFPAGVWPGCMHQQASCLAALPIAGPKLLDSGLPSAPDYPYKPPSLMMCTPNGRFAPNTKLCLSMTDFHPEVSSPCPCLHAALHG